MSNPRLELAFNFVEDTGVNIFLTGRAGTGKTTFLHNLRARSPKRIVVVAPTGVAAINAAGVTIHSFFQLPFGFYIPNSVRKDSELRKFSKVKIKIIRSMELLVIDEISMVRADMLDAIDNVLRRFRDKTLPFGGVQLLMIGDLQQLSPIIKPQEWDILKEYYPTPYFFDSIALKKSQYRNLELKQIYRQTDSMFIELLTKVRNGNLDNNTLEAINNRYIENFDPDQKEGYITLTSHNSTAKRINDSKLAQLKREQYAYTACIQGDFPEALYPVDQELILKEGAQVMFTRNDSEKKYVNGTIGEIISISEESIEVRVAGSSEDIKVELAQWENIKYSLDNHTKEITEVVEGTFIQYPLKTAWAITIHKSQGLTFDKVVIDAANSFSHGQVYVALSRCRTLEGVVLRTPIRSNSVRNDITVQHFTNDIEQHPLTEQNLLDDKQDYYQKVLIELFDFTELIINLRYVRRQLEEHLNNVYPKLVQKWNTHLELFVTDIDNVSIKFKAQITRLMKNPNYSQDSILAERITKGATYFIDKSETIIAPLLSTIHIDIDNKEVAKIIAKGMERILELYAIKRATLESCKDSFTIKGYHKAKAEILTTEQQKSKPEAKIVIAKSEIDDIVNSELYDELKIWRLAKSSKMGKAPSTIAHRKVLIAIAATKPTTATELRRIKGVGTSFIENSGAEVLKIVQNYSQEKKGLFLQ